MHVEPIKLNLALDGARVIHGSLVPAILIFISFRFAAIDQKPRGDLHLIAAPHDPVEQWLPAGSRLSGPVVGDASQNHPIIRRPATQPPSHLATHPIPPTSAWRAHNLVILFTV